jgi:hypothetical protein
VSGAPLLASQEENEWPREDHTNPFAQPERTGIVRVHQKSQDQPGAKVEPGRRTTAPDRRAHAVFCRRRHQPRRPPLAKIMPGSPAPTIGPGTDTDVVTTISSTAKSSAFEVKVSEVKGVPLKEIDPSGKLKPSGIVPVPDALPPALVESCRESVLAPFRANNKLTLAID